MDLFGQGAMEPTIANDEWVQQLVAALLGVPPPAGGMAVTPGASGGAATTASAGWKTQEVPAGTGGTPPGGQTFPRNESAYQTYRAGERQPYGDRWGNYL